MREAVGCWRVLWSTVGGSWVLGGDGAMVAAGTRQPQGAGRGQWGEGGTGGDGTWWHRAGGTCSLAMPCSRRRVAAILKSSTCPEQRQAPAPAPPSARGATAVSPPPGTPHSRALGPTHLAPHVALVGDPHHVLCGGGREP